MSFVLEKTKERLQIAEKFLAENAGKPFSEELAHPLFRELGVPEEEMGKLRSGDPLPFWYKEATWLRIMLGN